MLSNTVMAVVLGLAVLLWVTIIVIRGAGHQFPTAYQLLRESPGIARREWMAIRGLICLAMVFLLLLLTQLF